MLGAIRRRLRHDSGSAPAEFAMVSAFLVLVVLGVLQLTTALYVRNVIVDAAGEGARHGGLVGGNAVAAAERTRELITVAVGDSYAQNVTAGYETVGGVETVVVTVVAPVPVIGLIGIGEVHAEGHGVVETFD